MPAVRIGDGARVKNAILDKNVIVEPGASIGFDLERDRQRALFLMGDLSGPYV